MRVDGQLRLRINHVLAQAVPALHQRVQILSAGVHLHPSWVVFGLRRLCVSNCLHAALVVNFLVAPDTVCPHVCAVQVCLGRVEDHAVDGRLLAVLVVLDVLLHGARLVDGEDVAIAGVVIEGVAVHGIGSLLRGEVEDGACLGVGVVRSGCCLLLAEALTSRRLNVRCPPRG